MLAESVLPDGKPKRLENTRWKDLTRLMLQHLQPVGRAPAGTEMQKQEFASRPRLFHSAGNSEEPKKMDY